MPGVGVPKALLRGAKYLAANQLPNGGYISQSLSRNSTDVKTYNTTFIPSLILSCLSDIELAELVDVKQGLQEFLLTQKSERWSFNYWDRTSREFSELPYPDDLDDTFCALAALTKTNHKLFDGKTLGVITQLLFATETIEGGPYRTWLVDSDAGQSWLDTDIAVNANVGYFLSLHGVSLPNVEAYIESGIQWNKLSSPYYPNSFPIAYYISRWYRGGQLSTLLRNIQRRKHDTPLKTALLLTTMLNAKADFDPLSLVQYLLQTQLREGSWPAEAFCVDPTIQGKVHYAQSSSLTTAFCMEALNKYSQLTQHNVQRGQTARSEAFYKKVTREVSRTIGTIKNTELRTNMAAALDEMLSHDDDRQIILLPLMTEKVFGLKTDQHILMQLAATSLWGWIAYTIYDDFLDGEGNPVMLPCANFALRQVVTTLAGTMPQNPDFHTEVANILDKIDGANAWEIAHCRAEIKKGKLYAADLPDYGDYWQLAERSLGHTIAGLGVLYASGESVDSSSMKALKKFFYHYLIARQLNDDAHDWRQDLQQTHINAVGVQILRRWQEKGGLLKQGIDLEKELENLGLIMWQEVIQQVSQEIAMHVARARLALKRFPPGSNIELFNKLLLPLERASDRAVDERDKAVDFISTFEN